MTVTLRSFYPGRSVSPPYFADMNGSVDNILVKISELQKEAKILLIRKGWSLADYSDLLVRNLQVCPGKITYKTCHGNMRFSFWQDNLNSCGVDSEVFLVPRSQDLLSNVVAPPGGINQMKSDNSGKPGPEADSDGEEERRLDTLARLDMIMGGSVSTLKPRPITPLPMISAAEAHDDQPQDDDQPSAGLKELQEKFNLSVEKDTAVFTLW